MKQVADFLEQFDRCLAGEPAFCTAACPFHLDVRAFTESIEQGRLSAAYRLYRDTVGFPGIVSALCDRPCEAVCPLGENAGGEVGVGAAFLRQSAGQACRPQPSGAINLQGLERAVCGGDFEKAPTAYNLPPRGKRVAVVGAGLCGLGCALRLAQKKLDVTIFEASDRVARGEWTEEIALQFGEEDYSLRTGVRVASRAELNAQGFDAVFVCTGEGGADFGIPRDALCLLDPRPAGGGADGSGASRGGLADLSAGAGVGWFAGGALAGRTGVAALAHGLHAAAAIDAFLRTGTLAFPDDKVETKLPPPTKQPETAISVGAGLAPPADAPSGLDAATREAARCLRCRCDACMVFADLPAYTGKWPQRIRDEVFATTLPGKAEVKATPARRLINMDNLSGVFETVCPAGIDLDGLLLAGRQSLHRQAKMPWAFHEFHLRDMEHADGPLAALTLPYHENGNIAFFPGCQLGASDPSLVLAAWDALKAADADGDIALAGLLLRCCGAPAEWAGDEELFETKRAEILAAWEDLGRPTLAMACPSCMRLFEKHFPEVTTVSVYEILARRVGAQGSGAESAGGGGRGACAVFDPCAAARLSPEKSASLRTAVRTLAAGTGLATGELPIQKDITRCCGFGGQPDLADPNYSAKVAADRAAESDLSYLCYCSNCRDAFAKAGKPAMHVLSLLAEGGDPVAAPDGGRPAPTASERRENRERLRRALAASSGLPELPETQETPSIAQTPARDGAPPFDLHIPRDLLAQMDADHILVEDVHAVIAHMRETKESVYHPKTGVHAGALTIGRTTVWAAYKEDTGGLGVCLTGAYGPDAVEPDRRAPLRFPRPALTLTAAWTHRIAFAPEETWNALRRWTAAGTHKPPGKDKPIPEENETLICERCGVNMEPMEAEFSYLDRSFRHRVMRCPDCGLPYVPEPLARGRMRIVEMALEDK